MKRARCDVGTMMALALCLAFVAPAGADVPDHLKCYRVKDRQTRTSYSADLGGLVAEPGCRITVPAQMTCVPSTKTSVSPTPPGGGGIGRPNSFNCYKVKCPRTIPPPFAASDQFGTRTLAVGTTRMLCAPNAGPTDGGFPATGQTTCFSSGGTIPCAGTGQDGDLRKGAPLAYEDNGDGTITDTNTGLTWEKLSMDGSVHDVGNTYTFDNAIAGHVATLNTMSYAGHSDWRVPNVKELASIVNYDFVAPSVSSAFNNGCSSGCSVTTCSCTATTKYWTSTTLTNAPPSGWFVNFFFGSVNFDNKSMGFSVRAVRG